jgi:hypothetical protein
VPENQHRGLVSQAAAKMKEHKNVLKPKVSFLETFPQEGIRRPSAPVSGGPDGGVVDRCGTLTAAPVSTRYRWLVVESVRKIRPPRALTCPRRQSSFPPTCTELRTCVPSARTCCDSNTETCRCRTAQGWGGDESGRAGSDGGLVNGGDWENGGGRRGREIC